MSQNEQPIALGATKKKNLVVNYVLIQMANLILSELRPDDQHTREVQKLAERTKKRVQASHTEDELQPIKIMADVAVKMGEKLAACDNVDALNACRHYMDELANNRVLIMDDVENPEAYGLTPNQ